MCCRFKTRLQIRAVYLRQIWFVSGRGDNGKLLRFLCGRSCNGNVHILCPIVTAAETGAVQPGHNLLQRLVEVCGRCDDIGEIQHFTAVLLRVGQPKYTPQNLLHIHGRSAVCHRGQHIGKGAVPALFQGVDGNDVPDGAVWGQQVHIFQLVFIAGFDGDFLFGNAAIHQRFLDFFICGAIRIVAGLCLEQNDGTNIAPAGFLLPFGLCLQLGTNGDSIPIYICLRLTVIDNDRQLDHVGLFQPCSVHKRDDVAFLLGCGGQVKHKAGIEVLQHFHAQIRSGMVALIHDDHRIQIADHLNQCRLIGVSQQNGRIIHPLCKLGQITVLLIGFAPLLFAGAEGIIAEHKQRKLFCHGGRGEVLPHESLLLGIYLYPPAKIHIQPLAVGMVGIFQRLACLSQNGLGGHQPHHSPGPALGHGVKNRPQRTGGNIGLAAAGGHLGTHMGHTGEYIHIVWHTAEAH